MELWVSLASIVMFKWGHGPLNKFSSCFLSAVFHCFLSVVRGRRAEFWNQGQIKRMARLAFTADQQLPRSFLTMFHQGQPLCVSN